MDRNPGQVAVRGKPIEAPLFWRVEGSLLNLSAVRPVAFFTWNAQSFSGRWVRRGGLTLLALVRPLLYISHRVFATRVLHLLLRGVSRDRLDLLGEEYFRYVLKPRLKKGGVEKLRQAMASHGSVVLVSQALDHIMRPMAEYLGVEWVVANRLEFRDNLATGRLLEPIIRPRGGLARLLGTKADGRVVRERLAEDLGFADKPEILEQAITPAKRQRVEKSRSLILFDPKKRVERLSVRESLAGKHVLLIGVTGFIGKVWLANALTDLPNIGKIYLLIRRQRSLSARQRFERIVAESPVFEAFHERFGDTLPIYLGDRIEVIEGDICQPGLGIEPPTRTRLYRTLDLVINSSGLTDFNPDLRLAVATNVDATLHILDFVRQCQNAALLHLSTCYVAGARDGRVGEELPTNYTPARVADFDAERERQALHEMIKRAEGLSQSPRVSEMLKRQALSKSSKTPTRLALENQLRKSRMRWVRTYLMEAGMRRAKELGWPNTYTFTKSLAESLIQKFGSDLPIAVVRPSIVETSTQQPFPGWNEGINTSAPISHLLGTFFRQLPSNKRKCLDVIPVDLVCRGLMLIAAALTQRCHQKVYQLASSGINPCDMRRSIELTSLAHRKHYRAQERLEHWIRLRFETIPVSKARYETLSVPGQKAIVRSINRLFSPFPFRKPLVRSERILDRVGKLIELYEPFILHNEHVFESEHVELLSRALPPEEKAVFGYDANSIDWWEYWINIHIPALRKWSYPLIEGRPLESRPTHSFHLPVAAERHTQAVPASSP